MKDTFTTDSGALVRVSDGKTIRECFARTFARPSNGIELRATLRAGPYAWPGGYPMLLVTSDCAALCFSCARKEYRQLAYSMRHKLNDGWRVAACDINYENNDLSCDHCNARIPAAYGNDDNEISDHEVR